MLSLVVKMLHSSNRPSTIASLDPLPPLSTSSGRRGRTFLNRANVKLSTDGSCRGGSGGDGTSGEAWDTQVGGTLSGFSGVYTDSDDSAPATATTGVARRNVSGHGGGAGVADGVGGNAGVSGGVPGDVGGLKEAGRGEQTEAACDMFLEAVSTGGMQEELLATRDVEVRQLLPYVYIFC